MFDLNVYKKAKEEYDWAFQHFNNLSSLRVSDSEIDGAIFNLNAAIIQLDSVLNKQKTNRRLDERR
jgi:hypothetical protein